MDVARSNASTWRGPEGSLLQDDENVQDSSARNIILFASLLRASLGESAGRVRIDANAICRAWQYQREDGTWTHARLWDLAPTGMPMTEAVPEEELGQRENSVQIGGEQSKGGGDDVQKPSLLDQCSGSLFDAVQVGDVPIIDLAKEYLAKLRASPGVKIIENARFTDHVKVTAPYEGREICNTILDTVKAHHRSCNALSQVAMFDGE